MINIAVDGFSGSGKSTLVKALAERLGDNFKVLDTGAIFRAMGYAYDLADFGNMTTKRVDKFLQELELRVDFVGKDQHIFINQSDVTEFLRTEKVSTLASKISVYPAVREKYLEIAKKFAREYDCLMEGRDVGTVVLPNADVKIFLTADVEVRAKRRFKELIANGGVADFDEVLKNLKERDKRDSSRKVAPLMPSEESVVVDNTDMSFEETVEFCLEIINKIICESKQINIAIDGYVCSGKSTIARALAKKLGFKVFDTGAVYRGVACAFDYMRYDENLLSDEYVCKFAKQINVKVEFENGIEHVIVNGIDYTPYLRTEKTSALTAKISPFNCIRKKVLNLQRDYAKENNLVMEGRDIGSFVLPNADFKFFCLADEKVRAKRRFEQQKALGNEVDFDSVLKELKERDYKDVHREHGAVKILPTSIIIDTTHQSLEQSVEFCLNIIKKKFPNIKIY